MRPAQSLEINNKIALNTESSMQTDYYFSEIDFSKVKDVNNRLERKLEEKPLVENKRKASFSIRKIKEEEPHNENRKDFLLGKLRIFG